MLPLIAQAGNNGGPFGPGGFGDNPPELTREQAWAVLGFGGGACLGWVVLLAVFVAMLVVAMKALQKCRPANRRMRPNFVWLSFVPVLNLVWVFVTVAKVTGSLRAEFRSRGIERGESHGFAFGILAWGIYLAVNAAGEAVYLVAVFNADIKMLIASLPVFVVGAVIPIMLWLVYVLKVRRSSKSLGDLPWEQRPDAYDDDSLGDADPPDADERWGR